MTTGIQWIYPYLPTHRIKLETIDAAWNRKAAKGELLVANFDEDAITLAANTLSHRKKEWNDADMIIFSTTSSPFSEGSGAALLAYVLGTKETCRTVDLNQSINGGMIGLQMALDSVQHQHALVVAADRRRTDKGSDLEGKISDGACAVEIGDEKVLLRKLASSSLHDFHYDVWRREQDTCLRQWDQKFSRDIIIDNLVKTGRDVLRQANQAAAGVKWIVVANEQTAVQQATAKKLGFSQEQMHKSNLLRNMGYTGVSAPFLYLNEALLEAEQGDKILLLQYGTGAAGFLFEVTEEINRFNQENDLAEQLERKVIIKHYNELQLRRGTLGEEKLEPYASPVYMRRERESNLQLKGQVCPNCGAIIFPKRSNCATCHNQELFQWRWLERTGTIYTFTHDYLVPAKMTPVTMAVVDLDGGGRIYTQMTDYDPESVKIGNRVRLSFRKIHEGGGFPNYFWKAVPINGKKVQ